MFKRKDKPIATITMADATAWSHQRRILAEHQRILSMLQTSYATAVANLRQKYKLPEDFEVDTTTGAVYAPKKEANENG